MKQAALFTIFLSFLLISPATTWAEKVFSLKDGSQINGSLVGVKNGQYTIKSNYGTMTINESDIVSMGAPGAMPNPSANATPNYQGQISAMQNQIFSNPTLMADIQAMASDPEIMKLIQDPALMQAAISGNIQGVEGSPAAQQLMNNPKMQMLMQKLQGQQ